MGKHEALMARCVVSATVVLVMGLCVLSGCQTGNPFAKSSTPPPAELMEPADTAPPTAEPYTAPPETGLALSPSQRFADVPLPQGAKEDPEKTFVYEDKTVQVGRMVYTSKASLNELAQFYIRECPAADWKLQNVIQADGADLLFLKAGKRLKVNVRDLGITKGRQLILTVTPEGSL
ncbi:MAG: hypothetical protein IT364_26990 [Candidatus Hydrogenedentes bacterium]|nr:hypothetical protein [Candidatus Hydrogenedentota bacterium]